MVHMILKIHIPQILKSKRVRVLILWFLLHVYLTGGVDFVPFSRTILKLCAFDLLFAIYLTNEP